MSLVADYGDSSTSGSDSDSERDSDSLASYTCHKCNAITTKSRSAVIRCSAAERDDFRAAPKLPTPGFIEASAAAPRLPTSVFANPFKEAEDAKQAILEKHVKMVSTQEQVQVINGKKICWNYRKGRCRFGHNCIYAHDSDLQKSAEQSKDENKIQQTVLFQNHEHKTAKSTKKRPGLTQGLVPSKKIMKIYHEQHAKVAPCSTNKK